VNSDLNRTHGGTNLELAITDRLVESMEGLTIEGELGCGTRATVRLTCVSGEIIALA
jgi:signal transduction histidine kinase